MAGWYGVVTVVHVVAVISWMAGLLYLPRLFVYHSTVAAQSDTATLFKVMERRLLHAITIPAGIVAWLMGLALVSQIGLEGQGWLHVKLTLVLGLTLYTALCEIWRRGFAADHYPRSERFFRMVNEIPAVLMIFIVAMVILKPF